MKILGIKWKFCRGKIILSLLTLSIFFYHDTKSNQMSEDAAKILNYKEYLKQYPFNTRAKEFWKLFRVRGSLENRHIPFYMCQHCSNKLYNNQEKLKFEVDSEEKFAGCHINFILCEDCIERNIFEVNNYIYKYCVQRKSQVQNTVSITEGGTEVSASSQTSSKKKKRSTTPKQ